jgi:N,N'-diacetyllegionaminate synthase
MDNMNISQTISVGNRKIGRDYSPYIVAEMACAHEGSPDLAYELVDIAADAKSDAIQFQIVSVKDVVAPYHHIYEAGLKLEISHRDWKEIISYAKSRGLDVWVNAFDLSSLRFADMPEVDVIKLHSADLSNPGMLELAASIGKPMSLSTGGSTIDEIGHAVTYLRSAGVNDLLLMHGYQAFPTKVNESYIGFINTLSTLFTCPVGYQDHTEGGTDMAFILPITAVSLGAALLEKHITIDRSLKHTDYESALNPDEFRRFVELTREMDSAIGNGNVVPLSDDMIKYRHSFKKSIVASRFIKKGEILSKDMLCFLRADVGYAPTEIDNIIGSQCMMEIAQFTTLKVEHFK